MYFTQFLYAFQVNAKHVTKYVTQVLVAKKEAELKLENQKFGEKKEINKRKELLMSGMSEDDVDRHLENMKTKRVTSSKRKLDKISGQLERRNEVKKGEKTKKKPKIEKH
ncbi:hypothetical protein CRE_25007 [Caenorhabditis remanei]|uniref:Uncharacterized protein n=1 Tax=Caenorhabditis remanei TaxID=31234 RepID=E3MHU6_CAERE|nr:hypothetical protein CRE_25007 [Caenorhabditis remanei]